MPARRNSSGGHDGYEYQDYSQPLQPPQSAPGTFEFYNDGRAHGRVPSQAMLEPLSIPAHVTNNNNYRTSVTTSGGMTNDNPFFSADDGGFNTSSSTWTNPERSLHDREFGKGYGNNYMPPQSQNPYSDANMPMHAYDAARPDMATDFYSNKHPESGMTMAGDGSEKDMLNDSGKKRRRERRKCCGNG
ncbi:hypothetical protein LPJ73_005668, partial [Coemansia sp. RSA 2703]